MFVCVSVCSYEKKSESSGRRGTDCYIREPAIVVQSSLSNYNYDVYNYAGRPQLCNNGRLAPKTPIVITLLEKKLTTRTKGEMIVVVVVVV